MNKLFVFLFTTILVFISFGLNPYAAANNLAAVKLSATPKSKVTAKIERVELDKNEIAIPCPPQLAKLYRISDPDSPCFADEETYGLVTVKTSASNPKNKPLKYAYTISGGRIVGAGENVVWNLKGVRPGTYSITVAIDEGRGFNGETQTRTITVGEYCCCLPICECPTLSVTGGGVVKAGETMNFEANVSGGSAAEITYKWTASQGEIVEGQGTPQIKVKTSSETSGEVIATVEIGGSELCAECPRIAFETGTVVK